MLHHPAFVPCALRPLPHHHGPSHRACTPSFTCTASDLHPPDAGLIAKPGVTGTVCTNLWPLPVLGSYSWFLNVYNRRVAAATGPFVVHSSHHAERLQLSFDTEATPAESDHTDRHRAFRGIVTGNLNVRARLRDMADEASPYLLKFFDARPSELFFQRRNELHLLDPDAQLVADDAVPEVWRDPAPTFSVTSRTSAFEVRQIYSSVASQPRYPSKFEYFAMNLNPIFPFTSYSCYVCVWKQKKGGSPVAIDKINGSLTLSFFDPVEVPLSSEITDAPPSVGTFAVKKFTGAVTDTAVASIHKTLISSIAESSSLNLASNTDFRIVVDNTPNTLGSNRRNEMWIQLS